MKLTDPQLRLLHRLAAGEVLMKSTGLHSFLWWFNHPGQRAPSFPTLRILRSRKLIEDFERPELQWRNSRYRITDAGREAIQNAIVGKL